jgi:peptidoglycan/xylan/chitin deacetylase (PgdA/CDA1 family)
VVLCFDDALECLTDVVVPELVARKMPFTLGVPSGIANTGRSIWEFEIAFLIYLLDARKKLDSLVDMLHQVGSDLCLPTPELTREDSPAKILSEFNRFWRDDIPSDRRIALLDGLVTELQPDLHERLKADGRFCILRWDQLRELCSVGAYLAAHGSLHHPHNTTISEPCRLSELLEPLEQIMQHTGTATECFIWPEGLSCPSSIKLGKDLGYKYFFSTRAGLIRRDTSPLDIPRVSGQWPLPQLLWNAAGLE